MDPVTQCRHIEAPDTLRSSGPYRPATARDSSDPRSSAPTLAVHGTSELARNIDRVQDEFERDGSGSPESGRLSAGDSRCPEWCVDLGSTLKPMTTFELWIAIANGSVAPEMRVWRDGMDRWRKVRTIPELVHALPDLPMHAAANEATGTPPPTVRERSPSEITPVHPPRTSTASEPELDRDAPEPRTEQRTAPYRSGFFSVAIGAAFGLGALVFALITTQRIHLPDARATSPAAAAPRTVHPIASYARTLTARAQEWAGGATVDLDLSGQELVATEPNGPTRRPSLSARRRDPGQIRARRGSQP